MLPAILRSLTEQLQNGQGQVFYDEATDTEATLDYVEEHGDHLVLVVSIPHEEEPIEQRYRLVVTKEE